MDIRSRFAHLPQQQQEQALRAFPQGKKKKQSHANALTDAIREYCALMGCATARINVMGIWDQEKQMFRTSGSTKGVEDIDVTMPVTINGRRVGIKVAVEVKIGKDAQREHQILRQQRLLHAGAHYIIAKSFDQFKQEFDAIRNDYQA